MPSLSLDNLEISTNNGVLIRRFSHVFSGSQIIALVGDNGSGKTTLLKTLAGLNNPGKNRVFLDGNDLYTLQPAHRAQKISFLMQHSPRQPYCTAISRIAHGLMPTEGFNHFLDEKTRVEILSIAEKLNIHHLLDRALSKMSGGEQRLVNIAKCLINTAQKILLLDEPSVFLDFTQQNNLMKNLKQEREKKRLIIFSSHDAEFIRQTADLVLEIRNLNICIAQRPSSFRERRSNEEMAVLADTPS